MKVLTFADLHLRSTVPSCLNFTETEWMNVQKEALKQIISIAEKNDVKEVYVGGDIFHSESSTSFECIYLFQEFAKELNSKGIKIYILGGNHDLKYHSSKTIDKSAVGILFNSNYILNMADSKTIKGCNFDVEDYGNAECIFKHTLCIPLEDKPPMVECETPQSILEKYPFAKYIFLGDYHKKIAYRSADNRFVINSGCITKQASDFEDYTCGVFVVDLVTDDVQFKPINIEYSFYNNKKKAIDESLSKFADSIKKENVSLDYISSLKKEYVNHEKPIREKVDCWIDEVGQ